MNQKREVIPVTKLRQVRLKKGITLYKAAKQTGYSYSAICKAEIGLSNTGKNKCRSYDTRTDLFYETMAKYYGVPEEAIRP